ncbi:histone deacetylase 15 [Hibiscus trionum]|uniref:histone deacetylase n=1 Tax=Hibiscus trionum TaxID=183268 RepID=A0A9W7HGM2_HIBTR|nr:histone deacetylase 15 [Hibiscus trionum]
MASEAVQASCVMNGEAKNNQALKRKHLVSNENITACYCDVVSVDTGDIGTSGRDMFANINDDRQPNGTYKKTRLPKELTIQDMYNNQDAFDDDDDEEDDSDWEPVQKRNEIVKWFCTNCTMVNLDDVVHCDICGEHKASGILRHGFYASPCSPEGVQVESQSRKRDKDLQLEASSSNCLTAVGFDEKMLLHSEVEKKFHPHPERPDRLRAIAASLAAAGIFPGKCCPIPAREITKEELQKVHSLEHIEAVEFTSQVLSSYFSTDTYANEHSAHAARLAAGLCADLASAIFSGQMRNGFALVRPPGHHAGVLQAMGFCLHNNAAVAALAAQVAGAKKVLIIDWDVHHGNGTQEIFNQNKSVLYISLHRHERGKFYPGTGAAFEIGSKGAEGYCVNIPWSCGGVGDNDYIFAFQHVVLPVASEFAPDFTIISAGFDAACGDPLGGCDVTPAGYAQMTHMLSTLCGGKLLVILEGGYNLRSISSSATAVVKVLLGESSECEPENIAPSRAGLLTVLEVLKIQMKYWPTLSSSFEKLQAQTGMHCSDNQRKEVKKRRVFEPPMWWRWGRKQLLYHILTGHFYLR